MPVGPTTCKNSAGRDSHPPGAKQQCKGRNHSSRHSVGRFFCRHCSVGLDRSAKYSATGLRVCGNLEIRHKAEQLSLQSRYLGDKQERERTRCFHLGCLQKDCAACVPTTCLLLRNPPPRRIDTIEKPATKASINQQLSLAHLSLRWSELASLNSPIFVFHHRVSQQQVQNAVFGRFENVFR